MATKIRLQRGGRKARPIYSIVVADARAKRDGRFIEKLGTYNPNTNPATIDLNFDSALAWVMKGAQPTDTARAILSYRGVMMKKHLLEGVRKGALTEEQADAKYDAWLNEKESKIGANVKAIDAKKAADKKARLTAESEVNKARAAAIAAALAPAEEAPAEAAAEEAPAEAAAEEAPVEAADEEAPAEEAAEEAPAEAAAEEAPAEAAAEEAPAEAAAEEAPAEAAAEEAPVEAAAEEAPDEAAAEEAPVEAAAEEAPAEEAAEEAPAEATEKTEK
jgi:small subunit ribosomal protein S16